METITVVKNKRKRKIKKKKEIVKVVNVTRKTRKRRSRKRKSANSGQLLEFAKLISDPCHGPLIRAFGTGSLVERVRSTITINTAGTNNCGYLVWFPDFHCPGTSSTYACNAFMYENTTPVATPTNTTANPLGMVAINTTGIATADPAANLVQSASFSRGQTMAACLQIDYLGALSAVAGQVAIIKNFPLKAFAQNDNDIILNPPSVDSLFAYASTRERIQVTGHEAIYRPSDTATVMRSAGNERGYSATVPDSVWQTGTAGSTASILSCGIPNDVYGICIAWKGIPTTSSVFQLNMVKVLSLELAPSGNAIEPTFNGSPLVEEGPSPIDHVTSILDKVDPHWQTKAVNGAMNIAGKLASAFTENIGISKILPGIRGSRIFNTPSSRMTIEDL